LLFFAEQVKTFVDFLQKKAKRRKSHTFTFDELKAYSVEGNFVSLEIINIGSIFLIAFFCLFKLEWPKIRTSETSLKQSTLKDISSRPRKDTSCLTKL